VNVQSLMVGRPGLDPGTLRPSQRRSQASVSVHLSWSVSTESSLASADVSSNLLLRLHNWLQELDFGIVAVIRSEDFDGRTTQMVIDTWQH
jgi:hypothetical protein